MPGAANLDEFVPSRSRVSIGEEMRIIIVVDDASERSQ
jgi:hypothetical protein